ncbi:MAG TPA: Gfo/Idh/MocA family oxidoreductase [Gemmataceae bacterium]|nr:Gfo/Idh/MocA family oxidoreductase [Gemmataceae bacterium]
MERGNLSRRGFLQRSLAGLVAAGLPAWYAKEILAADKDQPSNERIVMGAIGIGSPQSRGRAIMQDAMRLPGAEYVAVCDVDKAHRERAVEDVKKAQKDSKKPESEVKAYEDFRELLDRKDIQAVTIATPEHWHTLVAIDAMRKGKDVYCEKPLTLTIAEGIALTKVAKDTGRIFQVGSQQRSDARFRLACELVRNGRIGKVKQVETRIGGNPKSPSLPKVDPPAGLNWDFWLGPTPLVDYVEKKEGNHVFTRCHYEFRWWYDYSGGKMTDWGAHHNDIAQWGLGTDEGGPTAVEAEGEEPSKEPNSYNCHPTFKVTYTYASGAKLICSNKQLPDSLEKTQDNGILFVGEDNKWIFVNRSTIFASDGDQKASKLITEPLPKNAKQLYLSTNHMGNFLDGVRSRKACVCTADIGHRSVTVCHIGVIALRTGKKLNWDPVKQQFDDAEANKMLSREMRKPWKLDV